jgi:hypothetical protein
MSDTIEQSYVLSKKIIREQDILLNLKQQEIPLEQTKSNRVIVFIEIVLAITAVITTIYNFFNQNFLRYLPIDFLHAMDSNLTQLNRVMLILAWINIPCLVVLILRDYLLPTNIFEESKKQLTPGYKISIGIDLNKQKMTLNYKNQDDVFRAKENLKRVIKAIESETFITLILKEKRSASDASVFLKKDAITYADFQRLKEVIPCLQGLSVDPQQFKQELHTHES